MFLSKMSDGDLIELIVSTVPHLNWSHKVQNVLKRLIKVVLSRKKLAFDEKETNN